VYNSGVGAGIATDQTPVLSLVSSKADLKFGIHEPNSFTVSAYGAEILKNISLAFISGDITGLGRIFANSWENTPIKTNRHKNESMSFFFIKISLLSELLLFKGFIT
jgi:hypothetical protein